MWPDYFLFLLKAVTVLVVLLILIGALFRASKGGQEAANGKLTITNLNESLAHIRGHMQQQILGKKEFKKAQKALKQTEKSQEKEDHTVPNAYMIRFKGDLQATQVAQLKQEVNAILTVARSGEEVVIVLESPGGAVSAYGLAASQLQRLKDADLRLTACVDQVAASGGYMMACIADRILAAPFSIIGSIGVMTQVPNIHRLLQRFDVDVDVLTAGKHKAPLTLMGENTEEGKQKYLADLEAIHQRFKGLVKSHRGQLDIDSVADGDFWLAEDAKQLQLVDDIQTSDAYLIELCDRASVYRVQWLPHKTLEERIRKATAAAMKTVENRLLSKPLP